MSFKSIPRESGQSRERNSESECIELLKQNDDAKQEGETGANKIPCNKIKLKRCLECAKYHTGKCPVSSYILKFILF